MTAIRVPVVDLAGALAPHLDGVRAAVDRVIGSGWFILGEEVARFEEEFAAAMGASYGVGVASGTDAVALALAGCGIGAGDGVVTVSHTAVATVAAIESLGATPILVDVGPDSFTMSPASLEQRLAEPDGAPPKAVVAVHLYGNPAPLQEICRIADAHGLHVVEDAAQAHGASLDGVPIGAIGRAAAFSFYPTKNLGAIGDGGMVVTSDEGVRDRVRRLRQYGWEERYVSDVPGRNSRLDELQAAVLRTLLPHLEASNEHRRAVAARYDEGLAGSAVTPPAPAAEGAVHVYHQYVVRTPARDRLRAHLSERGIGTAVLYPVPVHRQPAYRHLEPAGGLPVTDQLGTEILSLPMGPQVTLEAADAVVEAVLDFR